MLAAQKRPPAKKPAAKHAVAKKPAAPALDEQALQTQVMLDRAGFSPGEIDGRMGTSTKRALEAFTKNGGTPDAATAPLVAYTITDEDAAGPFTPDLPEDMMEKSKLPALGYKNLLEALGERFHASPALLKTLNPQATFAAGEEIRVPNVEADRASPRRPRRRRRGTRGRAARGRQGDARRAVGARPPGRGAAPARHRHRAQEHVGRRSSPTPPGKTVLLRAGHDRQRARPAADRRLEGQRRAEEPDVPLQPRSLLGRRPDARQGEDSRRARTIPVGVVWVDISRPHYGLHGTPEPSTVGKTTSHGCVRLTNWDAQKLAALVKPGTKVVFAE